ncbi:NAD(P)H-binding protein [Lactobacillus sp. LL6]|uniref:NmrA family NAD(P)-binding protein n=1 Tax=Lactobacillus sp. LL6 TaxID=2596827 RepID=UPI001186B14E|nr:NAD(P)H-binding protein [Lactobacillus sp. LL6]TSO25559.1 SDR family NAD(P)-dependent oxidoreductase [Lactobacillus sp. LL6]
MKYAVTAAAGRFGQGAVKVLNELVGAENVVVIDRNLEKAQGLYPNNEVRVGNYDEVASMEAALKGIDKVLFISSQPGGKVDRATAQKNVVDAMKKNGVKFVAYTSFPHAQTSKSALAEDHRITENAIKDAGIAHSFLRDNWYLENEIGFLKSGVADQPALYWANNKAGWALEGDYSEAAAKVLASENSKEIYELAGASRSYEELGEALKKATGNDFEIKQVSEDEYIKYLEKTGLDSATAAMFASFQAPINDGSLEENTNDLAEALGRPVTPIVESIKEVLAH